MDEQAMDRWVRTTGRLALTGGALGLAALVAVLVMESRPGGMVGASSAGVAAAGWASFVSVSLMAVGLTGFTVRYASVLNAAGRRALLVLCFATAMTIGATSTLALVVPDLLDRMPAIVNDPPAAVPPTFIFSGLVSGVCAVVIGVSLRRAGVRGPGVVLLHVGAVVTMVPLPSRFFLLALAVGMLVLSRRAAAEDVIPAGRPLVPSA